jgi:hypothetical protein
MRASHSNVSMRARVCGPVQAAVAHALLGADTTVPRQGGG